MGCKQSKTAGKNEKKLNIKKQKQGKAYGCKIAMLGSASVGKTSLISYYCLATKQLYGPTVGGAYFKKQYTTKDNQKITMNIWDTAGQQRYRSMASLYYRDADIIMIVFDLSDIQSFYQLDYWISQLENRLEAQNVNLIIIGNKMDLPTRKIKKIDMINWINKNFKSCAYHQVSALTGQGVQTLFQKAIQLFLKKNTNKN